MQPPQVDIPGYELLRELGAGGMATVFLALQRSLERQVAIKVMRRAGADENLEKRFLLEGRTMAKLPHRNIVGVYDIVQTDAINYIAMEYLGGGTLSERLADGLALAEAIAIVVQIAGALQFAHDNGVVHRDLKPANIMFRDRFTPVLTDFGIARQQGSEATRLTQTGMMIGTPTYMSPEQATGEDVDGRSDQYSLGVLFYEMLTGAPPFTGETPLNVVLAHLHQPAPPLPLQFAHFQPVMDRLLAKRREERYPDLKNFVAELKSLLTHSDTLMARLRIDPSQSASEQLRALGFSESQINTGAGATPSAMAAAVGAARTGEGRGVRSTGRGSTGPGVRLEAGLRGPGRGGRPAWLLPAGLAAVLLVAAVLVWALVLRDSLSPELRAIVNDSLASADRLIEQGKLVSPSGDNAYEKIQTVLQVVPGLPEAEERLVRIVTALRGQAEQALDRNAFAVAETRIGEALAVRPQDPALLALKQRLETARLDAAREQQVRELLAQADAAEQAGRALGDGADTALALLRQALQLAPGHPQARQRLDALREQALKPARDALAGNRLEEARTRLLASSGWFAADPAWQALQAEIDGAREREAQRARIAELMARARQQLQAGRLAEPAGDNALETLARVRELDADNADAAALHRDIAGRLAGQAADAERGGDPAAALALYEQALQAQPGEPRYAAARDALQARLGERQVRVSQSLSAARAAITQRRLLQPADASALHHLQAVLELDPRNAEARRLLQELPRLVGETAAELAREQRPDAALSLLQAGLQQYPDDAGMALQASQLRGQVEQARAEEVREQHLSALRELLAQRQLNADTARGISVALDALLKANPRDAEALGYRETFVSGIATVIGAARDPQTLDQLAPILGQVKAHLGSRADIASLENEFTAARARVQAAEQARIAASSGTLLLNAQPWATVESVVDQGSGRAVELPRDASTPLRLTVPAGTYRIAFRHPSAAEPVVLVGSVKARDSAAVAARFPTLTAERFLEAAGFSP